MNVLHTKASLPANLPAPVAPVVQEWVDGITKLHDDLVVGIYLTGSITLNDYHPGKSDIDFIVLCNYLPARQVQQQLKYIHKKIEHNFPGVNLSGYYITTHALNVHHASVAKTLCYHEGQISKSNFQMAVVTLYELKRTAITLFGVDARSLPITVDLKDLNTFLYLNINSYWKSWIDKTSWFNGRLLLLFLFPRLTEWIILGVARQLFTLKTGEITSKTEVGHFCLQHLTKHRKILQEAVSIRNQRNFYLFKFRSSYYIDPSITRVFETRKCAEYVIHLFNAEYNNLTASNKPYQ